MRNIKQGFNHTFNFIKLSLDLYLALRSIK